MKAEVEEATKYHSLCVGEEAPESSSIPLTSSLPCPSTLTCLGPTLKSKQFFVKAGRAGEAEGNILT